MSRRHPPARPRLRAEVKAIVSPDLSRHDLPDDPQNTCVNIIADIGVEGGKGADMFTFYVQTPNYPSKKGSPRGPLRLENRRRRD